MEIIFDVMGVILVLAAVVVIALFVNKKTHPQPLPKGGELTPSNLNPSPSLPEGEGDVFSRVETPQCDVSTTGETAVSNDMLRAKDTLLAALKRMGCKYEVDEEDHSVRFDWQGGHFCAYVDNDSPFVSLWFFQWNEWELYDIDTLSRVKRIMNDVNINSGITLVYSVNESASTFNIHSKKHALFLPQIPESEAYLRTLLGEFFAVCRYTEVELEKLKNQEEATAQ